MRQRKKSTGIIFDIFILSIPVLFYIKTQYLLFIIPACTFGFYVVFNQLKIRHERQMFIEPQKLNFYTRGRNLSLFLIFASSAVIEFYAIYVDTAT